MTVSGKDVIVVVLSILSVALVIALVQANLALSAVHGQCMTAREAETIVRSDERLIHINELCVRVHAVAEQSLVTDIFGDAATEENGHGEVRSQVTGAGSGVSGAHAASRR